MQKVIIFEGHDMTGKTNIANKLSSILNIPVFKFTKEHDLKPDFKSMLFYTAECQVQICEQTDYSFIFDRFMGSEYSYSKFHNRSTDATKIFDLDSRIANLRGVIIYCYKTEKEYIDDDLGRYIKKDYNLIKDFYEEFLTITGCKIIRLCTDDFDIDRQINYILKELNTIYENNTL